MSLEQEIAECEVGGWDWDDIQSLAAANGINLEGRTPKEVKAALMLVFEEDSDMLVESVLRGILELDVKE